MKRHIVSIIFLCVICLVGCKIEEPHGNNKDGFQENKVEVSLNSGEVEDPKSKEEEYPVNGVKFYFDEGCTAYRNGEYDANLAYSYAAMGQIEKARESLAIAREKGYAEEKCEIVSACIDEFEEEFKKELIPTPNLTEIPQQKKGIAIAIDPGHQGKGNYEKEPVGPGAAELKTKVSSGTQGVSTKVPEHRFTLDLSLQLRDALTDAGYEVVLTRETADVNISNVERAEIANAAEADIFIRIHADGADNREANGISVLYPSENNPYVANLSPDSKELAQAVLDGMCETTGAKNRGIIKRDDLSGTNWAKMPVILIEAGFMTNEEEDRKLQDPEYQGKLVKGIVEGIEEYFKE